MAVFQQHHQCWERQHWAMNRQKPKFGGKDALVVLLLFVCLSTNSWRRQTSAFLSIQLAGWKNSCRQRTAGFEFLTMFPHSRCLFFKLDIHTLTWWTYQEKWEKWNVSQTYNSDEIVLNTMKEFRHVSLNPLDLMQHWAQSEQKSRMSSVAP